MKSMASAIEKKLMRIKREAEKRQRSADAVEVNGQRLEELKQKITGLSLARDEINNPNLDQAPVSDILEIVLISAVVNGASDIHFESESTAIKIRFRIDGALHDIAPAFSKETYKLITSRVKLLSKLKLDITTHPQDGHFSVMLPDRSIEIRVSVVPSEHGETIVMRVLDPIAINIALKELGLRPDDLEIISEEIRQPHGMILNTGPTGSGKTTTLYSFLRQRYSSEIKIITIEDPIEYDLEGVEQTQVNREAGYTFANGLASIMRQDPDVILIGEIRDDATAGIAIQAALTGHLVFSTIHANRAAAAIPRLLDLKAKPTSIGPALNLIMAQRLVKKLCKQCRKLIEINVDLETKVKRFINNLPARVDKNNYQALTIYEAVGCSECDNSGYKGRTGIFELLPVNKEIEELIEKSAGEVALEEFAVSTTGGMVTVQQDGILKVLKGVTDFSEVERVTGSLHI